MNFTDLLAKVTSGKKVKLVNEIPAINAKIKADELLVNQLVKESIKRTRASASVERKIKKVKSEPMFTKTEAELIEERKVAEHKRELAIALEQKKANLKQSLIMTAHVDAYRQHVQDKIANAKAITAHMTKVVAVKATRRGTTIELSKTFQDTGDALDKRIANCNDLLRSLYLDIVITR
jgi:hypothetical protein